MEEVTPAEIIAEVRNLVQDTRTPLRYSDPMLLGFVNQTLKRMALVRPDLFTVVLDLPTAPNTVIQRLPTDAVRLMGIYSVVGGSTVVEAARDTLDRTTPGWMTEAPGVPVNFVRHARNPYHYFLHPAPTPGVRLLVEYVRAPPNYTLSQPITEPHAVYFPVVVDGVVFMAESIDNEHVNSNRAKMSQDSFLNALTPNV